MFFCAFVRFLFTIEIPLKENPTPVFHNPLLCIELGRREAAGSASCQ